MLSSKNWFVIVISVALLVLTFVSWFGDGWSGKVALFLGASVLIVTGSAILRVILPAQPTPLHHLTVVAIFHSDENQQEVIKSESAGCFNCFAVFAPEGETFPVDDFDDEYSGVLQNLEWVGFDANATDPVDGTLACPRCGHESVIGSASGYPLSQEFLSLLHHQEYSGLAHQATCKHGSHLDAQPVVSESLAQVLLGKLEQMETEKSSQNVRTR